jgi:RHS repeat-associated protein
MLPQFALINMNGRMYDPLLGRMLRPDIQVGDMANTQAYNMYSYALNNPLKYTDPSGWENDDPTVTSCSDTYTTNPDGSSVSSSTMTNSNGDSYSSSTYTDANGNWNSSSTSTVDGVSTTTSSWGNGEYSSTDGISSNRTIEGGTNYSFPLMINSSGTAMIAATANAPSIDNLPTQQTSPISNSNSPSTLQAGGSGTITSNPEGEAIAGAATAMALTAIMLKELVDRGGDPHGVWYTTYTKTNPQTGYVYVGHTAGYGTPQSVVAERDYNHAYTKLGYGPAVVSTAFRSTGNLDTDIDPSFWAMRGSEQLQIELNRLLGISGNDYNAISPHNDNLNKYIQAAKDLFGF